MSSTTRTGVDRSPSTPADWSVLGCANDGDHFRSQSFRSRRAVTFASRAIPSAEPSAAFDIVTPPVLSTAEELDACAVAAARHRIERLPDAPHGAQDDAVDALCACDICRDRRRVVREGVVSCTALVEAGPP
jgi:hypothetical protein